MAEVTGGAPAQRAARGLGLVSLGLGAAQLLRPRVVTRLSGVDDSATAKAVVPLVGARELVHAAGLLAGRDKRLWAWTRVAGDAVDLVTLGRALRGRRGARRRRAVAVTAAVGGITAFDLLTAVRLSRGRAASEGGRGLQLRASVTINRPPEEVYAYWKDVENLPTFMAHLVEVRAVGSRRSHWVARGPAGKQLEWDAEIVDERPGEFIAWRSVQGANVDNNGTVTFAPTPRGQGTEVRIEMEYAPPGRRLGRAVAKLFGEAPEQQVRDDLRRLKQVLETGEVVRSAGSPEGTRALRQAKQLPAQPMSSDAG